MILIEHYRNGGSVTPEWLREMTAMESEQQMPRLPTEELFRIGPEGLQDISDDTLRLRLDEAERRTLARQSDPGYAEAVAEETIQQPEAV